MEHHSLSSFLQWKSLVANSSWLICYVTEPNKVIQELFKAKYEPIYVLIYYGTTKSSNLMIAMPKYMPNIKKKTSQRRMIAHSSCFFNKSSSTCIISFYDNEETFKNSNMLSHYANSTVTCLFCVMCSDLHKKLEIRCEITINGMQERLMFFS